MRWMYVVAVVDVLSIPDDGPGAIRFMSSVVEAVDEDAAYNAGAEAIGFGRLNLKSTDIVNDYVIPIPSAGLG